MGLDPASLAARLRARREAAEKEEAAAPGEGGLVLTGLGEITRRIQLAPVEGAEPEPAPESEAPPLDAGEQASGSVPGPADEMEVDATPDDEPGEESGSERAGDGGWGEWTAADQPAEPGRSRGSRPPRPPRAPRSRAPEEESVLGDKAIGSGLAGVLGLLHQRGDLQEPVEWAGRTNDSRRINVRRAVVGSGEGRRAAAWMPARKAPPARRHAGESDGEHRLFCTPSHPRRRFKTWGTRAVAPTTSWH